MTTDRGYPWLKMYPTWLDEPKFLRLTDGAMARYIELYLLAGKADAGGLVVLSDDTANPDDLAFILRKDVDSMHAQLAELEKAGLVSTDNGAIYLPRFQEEQGPSQTEKRDAWKERQAKKRGKYLPPVQAVTEAEALSEEEALNKAEEEEEALALEVTRESRVTPQSTPTPSNFSSSSSGELPIESVESHSSGKPSTPYGDDALLEEARSRVTEEVDGERWNDVTAYALAGREQFGWSRESTIGFIVDNVPDGEFEARLKRDKKNGKKPAGYVTEAQQRQAEAEAKAQHARYLEEEAAAERMNNPAQKAKNVEMRKDATLRAIRKALETENHAFWGKMEPEKYRQALAEREAGDMSILLLHPDGSSFSWETVPYKAGGGTVSFFDNTATGWRDYFSEGKLIKSVPLPNWESSQPTTPKGAIYV